MLDYVAGRIVRALATIFFIVTAVFFATRLSGDAIDFVIREGMTQEDRIALTAYYGLDGSIWSQYLAYLRSFVEGEFGLSFIERRPVADIVAERIGPSLQLIGSGLAFTFLLSLPLGILAALYRKSWLGSAVMTLAFLGYAVPNF
ncbi:MAG: ABC transporter permease, partial [Alphaproteobacteria bacterium]